MQNKFRFIIGLSLILSLSVAQSQVVSLYSSVQSAASARGVALGDAYISDASEANAFYWNPATVSNLTSTSIVLNHSAERVINGMNENLAIPIRFGEREALGLGLTVNHVGYMNEKSTVPFRVLQYGYDIAYGREIIPTLNMGVGVGVRYAKTDLTNRWGVNSTIGLYYAPSGEISYGAILTGVGTGIRYRQVANGTTLLEENLYRSFQIGASMRFPAAPLPSMFTVAFANEKIFSRDGIRYKAGFEYAPITFLALRAGYIVDPDYGFARFGLGFRTDRLQLDYALSPSKLSDQSYHISLSLTLGRTSSPVGR